MKLHDRSQKKKKLMPKKANTKMFYKFNEKSNQIMIIIIIIIIITIITIIIIKHYISSLFEKHRMR